MIGVDTNILVYAHRCDAQFHDAAATCLRELWTLDRDFGRFPGLRVSNPLR
jgi:predicted nucleic acid-binding protein